ncbi:MAG: enoyl-ACP reductase [Planctomycetes bacterium]|nr:enoyl-ACP reductase [Planctomycetota bacterium]MBU4398701.1 enoyl-ACP reductase [Planctomycetota bacterium]MCG2682540.1 enoyl-ACP reductase [Planctomycetales bacterium]
MGMFTGKIGLAMGVANERSIAWAIGQALLAEGAELAFTHLPGPSNERRVAELVSPHGPKIVLPCDVQNDADVARVFDEIREVYGRLDLLVHSIAFAPPQELCKPYVETSRAGWRLAMDISVYSLVAACRAAAPLMADGGTVLTISYYGGEKVVPGYNVMGVCKAALEHSVRYLAWDLGRRNVRVNCLSAGPLRTLSSAGIAGFDQLREHAAEKSPLGRNVEADEIAATALYLLGPNSNGVTGETIHVDCGYSIVGL